ncbi:MAG: hypothetical protein ACLURG_11290 [Gemmiger sp.]
MSCCWRSARIRRTLQDRLLLANDLRDVCPHCKTVLLVDEAEYPELATAVCLAKRTTLSMISSTLPSRRLSERHDGHFMTKRRTAMKKYNERSLPYWQP